MYRAGVFLILSAEPERLFSLPGWKDIDITGCRSFEELPENAQRYIEHLEELAGVPISIIAVGPDRDQTIMRGW